MADLNVIQLPQPPDTLRRTTITGITSIGTTAGITGIGIAETDRPAGATFKDRSRIRKASDAPDASLGVLNSFFC
jgi:hypothetical protein